MMYGVKMRSSTTRTPSINERMSVSSKVRLPDGDVDMETSIPISRSVRGQRNPRFKGSGSDNATTRKTNEVVRDSVNKNGITIRALCLATAVLSLTLGMFLLLQMSELMEKSKQASAVTASIENMKAQNEQLRVSLAEATSETDVAYSAAQRLGLIAGKGADSVYVQVPDKYTQLQNVAQDVPPIQSGSYAALLGFMD